MFYSKREPRIGDFLKMILIKEPNKFTSFHSIFLFLHQLYPLFSFDFFDEEYLEALFKESEESMESEEDEDEVDEDEEEGGNVDITGQESIRDTRTPALKPPSFGNIGALSKNGSDVKFDTGAKKPDMPV